MDFSHQHTNMLKPYLKTPTNSIKDKTKQPLPWFVTLLQPLPYFSIPVPTRVHFLISPWPSLQPTPVGFIPIICTDVVLIKVITDLYLERTSDQFCILIWLHFSTASGSFLKHFLIFPSSFLPVCVLQGSVLQGSVLHSLLFFSTFSYKTSSHCSMASNILLMLMTLKCLFPTGVSSLNSRFIYPSIS